MQSLKNKVALITGAGRGIGRALAIALANEGVNIGLIGKTESHLQDVSKTLSASGVKTSIGVADVSNMESVNKAVEGIKEDLGNIDILINNAGIAKFGKFLDLDPADWEAQIKVNLFGPYYVTRAVLPAMIEKKSGDIVNVASTAGLKGGAMLSAYSASKFGLIGLTESLMQEVRKHNIRVTCLMPSTVITDLAKDSNLINNNEEKLMHPEDFAELVVSQLKLNKRVFVKDCSIWATNP